MRDFSSQGSEATPAGRDHADVGAKPGGQTLTESASSGPGGLPHRAQMETAFGQDFSSVQARTGESAAMGQIGASAAARGESVSFAETSPSPWLVAHELTHVVQHRQAGGQAGVAKKATIAPVHSAPEREADAVADRVSSGQPAGEITARPEAEIHRFAPVGHRGATVAGLQGSFSAEEIGDIYASNWERDFSQGNGDIASATLAWLSVKNHAAKNGGDPGPAAATFQAAVWKVVNGNLTDATDESLGGYKYWEHMDHPTATLSSPDKEADKRWAKHGNGLAGYLLDARAHIKDQMVAAVDFYRQANSLGAVGGQGKIDNWNGAAKPEGYVAPTVNKTGSTTSSTLPGNYNDPKVASRDPVREETAAEATAAGAKTDPKHNEQLWQIVGQHLGRAMHSFEDFWAHSNWLEMAKLAHTRVAGGGQAASGEAANKQLKTGTFEMASKAHALGHKLLALASGFQKDFPLLLKVYGRSAASTKLDSKEAKTTRSTIWGGNSIEANNDHDLAYKALQTDSYSTLGEISDVGDAVNNVEELVLSKKYKMDDFLCNQQWLEALANKGRILIKQGDDNSDENAHGKLAKDQEESGSNKDYDTALTLAKTADAMVFGPLRAVMDEKDAAKALAATTTQLTLVDSMLQAPTPSHPLWLLVK